MFSQAAAEADPGNYSLFNNIYRQRSLKSEERHLSAGNREKYAQEEAINTTSNILAFSNYWAWDFD